MYDGLACLRQFGSLCRLDRLWWRILYGMRYTLYLTSVFFFFLISLSISPAVSVASVGTRRARAQWTLLLRAFLPIDMFYSYPARLERFSIQVKYTLYTLHARTIYNTARNPFRSVPSQQSAKPIPSQPLSISQIFPRYTYTYICTFIACYFSSVTCTRF